MDPYSQQQPNHELPTSAPQGDMVPLSRPNESQPTAYSPEQSMLPSAPMSPVHTPSIATPPPITMPHTQAVHAQSPSPSALPVAPAVANDLDLIEKEWVEKAKSIVAQTRTDPHAQNNQMNSFKADYMKKRYGKDIKIEK